MADVDAAVTARETHPPDQTSERHPIRNWWHNAVGDYSSWVLVAALVGALCIVVGVTSSTSAGRGPIIAAYFLAVPALAIILWRVPWSGFYGAFTTAVGAVVGWRFFLAADATDAPDAPGAQTKGAVLGCLILLLVAALCVGRVVTARIEAHRERQYRATSRAYIDRQLGALVARTVELEQDLAVTMRYAQLPNQQRRRTYRQNIRNRPGATAPADSTESADNNDQPRIPKL